MAWNYCINIVIVVDFDFKMNNISMYEQSLIAKERFFRKSDSVAVVASIFMV